MPINRELMTNKNILNALRSEAGLDYQSRIPFFTKESIAEMGNALTEYDPTYEKFTGLLVNKLISQYVDVLNWENPLKGLKGNAMQYGHTIEEIHVNIAKAVSTLALNEHSEHVRTPPDLNVIYHSVNRFDTYRTTLSREQLSYAMFNEGGLSSLSAQIVQSLYNGDEQDEYLIMKELIAKYYRSGYFYPVTVGKPAMNNTPANKEIVANIQEHCLNMRELSREYNSLACDAVTPADNQLIITTNKVESIIGVDVLAYAFNMEKADYLARRIHIKSFGDGMDNVIAILFDKDLYIQRDTNYAVEQKYNGATQSWNIWLHHAGLYSLSRFAQAIAFVAEETSVENVTITPNDVQIRAGSRQLFNAVVTGKDGAYIPQAVAWQIASVTTDPQTNVFADGTLSVGTWEKADTITLVATSVYDESVYSAVEVPVVQHKSAKVTAVDIDPKTVKMKPGEDQQFTVEVFGTAGLNDKRYILSLEGKITDSDISTTGLLRVGASETAKKITVVAKSVYDMSKSDKATVTIE